MTLSFKKYFIFFRLLFYFLENLSIYIVKTNKLRKVIYFKKKLFILNMKKSGRNGGTHDAWRVILIFKWIILKKNIKKTNLILEVNFYE